MSTKIYVHLTGIVPNLTLSTLAKPVKITNSITSNYISVKDLLNLFDLTTRDTYNNIINNAEFKEALRLNYLKAYDEHSLEIDVFKDKYPDLPEVKLDTLAVNPVGLQYFNSTNMADFVTELDTNLVDIVSLYDQALTTLNNNLTNAIGDLNTSLTDALGTLTQTVEGLDLEVQGLAQDVASNTDGLNALRALNLFPDQFDIKTAQWVYSTSANANKCADFINATGANGWEISRTGGGNAPSYTTATVDAQTFQTPYFSLGVTTG